MKKGCYLNVKCFLSFVLLVAVSVAVPVMASLPVTDGLVFWLDASETSSVIASDGSLADGERISGWNDILAGSNSSADNALQTDGDKQPVWVEAQPWANNNSVVRFNGSGTWLNASSLYIDDETTIFCVSQSAIQTDNQSTWHRPLIAADSDDPFDLDTGDGYGISYSRRGVTSFVGSLADTGYGMDQIQTNDMLQDFAFNTTVVRRAGSDWDGAELYVQKSGDPNLVLKAAAQFYKTSGLHTGYDIGANPPEHDGHSVRFYNGDIAEIIIYNRTLSDTEMKEVGDYLYGRYHEPNVCGRPGVEYLAEDLNKDCVVDIHDIAMLSASWLGCTDSSNPNCAENYQLDLLAKERWENWRQSRDEFPIAAWAYFGRYLGAFSEYQLYADAGLTMVQNPIYHYEAATAAGLESMIGSWEALQTDEGKLDYYVNFPTPDDDNVVAYLLKDEPRNQAEFDLLSLATEYIYRNDSRGAIPIVNLLPGGASYEGFSSYDDYVQTYVDTVKPAVLSYDHYPILSDGTDKVTFYSDMETIRSKADAAGVGFMGFALVNDHYSYRLPSESDLNWMAYSLISYGAKGLFYYNWRIEPADGFGEGLVTHADATPTSTYPMAQALNAEIQNIGSTLLSLDSVAVYHTADSLPQGTTAYANGTISGVTNLSASNYIISEFENADDVLDDDVYLMLMNKDHGASLSSASTAASAVITVDSAYPYVYQYDPATGNLTLLSGSNGTYTINLGGGKALLLRVSADSQL
jgi:hypothetical protein